MFICMKITKNSETSTNRLRNYFSSLSINFSISSNSFGT